MSIENGIKEKPEVGRDRFKEAFASISALRFVLDLDGSLDPSIDKEQLIRYQTDLILKDVKNILPDLDGVRVNGLVALRPDCKEDGEHEIYSLEYVEEILFAMGKELGFLQEI